MKAKQLFFNLDYNIIPLGSLLTHRGVVRRPPRLNPSLMFHQLNLFLTSTSSCPRARPLSSLSSPSPPPPDPIPYTTGHPCPGTPSLATLPSTPMRPPRPFLLKSASHGSPCSRTQPPPPPRAQTPIPPSLSPLSAPLQGGRRAPPTSVASSQPSHDA
jgi:hypothetical protein